MIVSDESRRKAYFNVLCQNFLVGIEENHETYQHISSRGREFNLGLVERKAIVVGTQPLRWVECCIYLAVLLNDV
jgi:hypothetical protein